jgi:hypothetical protein
MRCTAVRAGSKHEYTVRCRAYTWLPISPFCFTLSKEATRSDNDPGNILRGTCCCCGGCCSADGGRCASSLTPGGNCGCCACACAAGGNGEEASGCCCGCGCRGAGDCAVSSTEALGAPVGDTTGAGACHALLACSSAGAEAAGCCSRSLIVQLQLPRTLD